MNQSQTAPPRQQGQAQARVQVEQWLDFNTPDLWDSDTQIVADEFRNQLESYSLNYCVHCSRLQNLDPRYIKEGGCKHCKERHRDGRISHFGADNGMDPGKV